MTVLFLRQARLTISPPGEEGRAFENLRITFNISKTISPEPNKAFIRIYNLSRESRNRILMRSNLVQLEVAYSDAPLSTLFFGDLRFVSHKKVKADWISELECGDGDPAWRDIRVNEFSGPNTQVSQVFRTMKEVYDRELRQIIGNVESSVYAGYDQVVSQISGEATSNTNAAPSEASASFLNGISLSGKFGRVMTNICNRAGLNFFINNQTIYIIQKNAILDMEPIVVSPTSGLIGRPVITESGGLSGSTLILPGMIPGRGIVVESQELVENQDFKLTRINFDGDTYDKGWYANFEAIDVRQVYQ